MNIACCTAGAASIITGPSWAAGGVRLLFGNASADFMMTAFNAGLLHLNNLVVKEISGTMQGQRGIQQSTTAAAGSASTMSTYRVTHLPASTTNQPTDSVYQLYHQVFGTAAAAMGPKPASSATGGTAKAVLATNIAGLHVSAMSSPTLLESGIAHVETASHRSQALPPCTLPSAPTSVVAAVTHSLGAAQRCLPALASGSSLTMHLDGMPCSIPSLAPLAAQSGSSVMAASLNGIAKVAAAEFPTIAVLSLQHSSMEGQGWLPGALPAEDARSGAAITGKVVIRSKLTKTPGMALPGGGYLMPTPRGSLANLKLTSPSKTEPGSMEVKVGQV